MRLKVNGKDIEFGGETLAELLSEVGFTDGGFAAAVGTTIIQRQDHNTHTLHEGDIITVIVATHGG
ncbi:MAG: sulfur carrier protein ThiS [Rikenellaceae bacterium]